MNWRRLKLVVLAVLLVAGGLGALYLSTVLQQRADSMTRYVRVDVWAVQKAEYELQQFRAVFARHVAGETVATSTMVQDHLVRARSAIPLLKRNPDYHEFRLLADIKKTTGLVTAALDDVARGLGGRTDFRGDLAMLRRVEDLLAQPAFSLRKLAFDLAHIRLELQDGDLENVRWLTDINIWMLLGFFGVALVFIAFLLTEMVAARRAEAQASEARQRLADAIESIEEGFALYDRHNRLVLCNSRFKHFLFGPEPPRFEGLCFAEVMRLSAEAGRIPAAGSRTEEWLETCLAYHRNPVGVFELLLCDETHLQIGERKTFDGGTVAIYADITESKRRETKLREALHMMELANRSKTEFLANMSHELRTPLNAIIGFSEMFKLETFGPLASPQYKDYAYDIHDSAGHLLAIINDILDVSKIEAGERDLNEAELNVEAVIESCLRLVKERAERADHTIAVELSEVLPGLYAEERALKQILLNLLSNAIKFTPDRGRISVAAGIADDGGLELCVIDTGIGIAAEDTDQAMSHFGQVDAKLERNYEGTGLGLPLARSLIELHGGTIRLESEVGVGTTVTVRFPAERVFPRAAPNSHAPALSSRSLFY